MQHFVRAFDSEGRAAYNRDMKCMICPRKCGADRSQESGFCGGGRPFKVAKIMKHFGEEPIISGENGSGAIFFAGCSLRCVYCQNAAISRGLREYRSLSADELLDEAVRLARSGVHNINLVTAAHYATFLVPVLRKLKSEMSLPIVYNSGGYESVETLRALEGLVDIYLPDYKYISPSVAKRYSAAPDYPEVAHAAIREMLRQQPTLVVEDGIARRGVIIRHLLLPGQRMDAIRIVRTIGEDFDGAALSLMRQYTPEFNSSSYRELDRKVTSFEYDSVVAEAARLGIFGFTQEKGCETSALTPNF